MYRKFILDQLAQCAFASPTAFNKETHTFSIPRYTKPKYDIGKCYIVQLPDHLLRADSILATNWNQNRIPPGVFLKIFVSKALGKMIYTDAVLFDPQTQTELNMWWSGWLPVDEIKQLSII